MIRENLHLNHGIALLGAIFIRWAIALSPYSGAGKPPMYGDYEAQRHWMEITYNLPIKEWYVNSTENDLMYWGLDYPPLTAYHSWICGVVANFIDPRWVELGISRGFESYNHKLFMRYTVLIVDVAIYITAVFAFVNSYFTNIKESKRGLLIGLILLFPGLNLVDYGHFQYNCVSLGLALWAIVFLVRKQEILASIFFTLALNYKQMELYHAFPFFFYLAGLCWKQSTWLRSFIKLFCIGCSVIFTFAICWLPFLSNLQLTLQVLHRIFPFARGLYEDKVANFWCSISVIVKIKNILSVEKIVQLCLVTTLIACIPSCFNLFFNPTIKRFLLSLVNCSLAFFLFSFQVHEKSILIAALPICLLLPSVPFECTWFLLISTFSMYPLLERDDLPVPYIATMVMFVVISDQINDLLERKTTALNRMFILSLLGAIVIHLLALFVKPPPQLPDLFPVLFSVYSCGHFLLALIFFNWIQIKNLPFEDEHFAKEVEDKKSK